MRIGASRPAALVALICLAGVVLLPAERALALTAIELSLKQLVAASTLVLEARPSESLGVWEDTDGIRSRRIVTYTRLDVLDVLDGRTPGEPVWVRTLGGRVGDIGQQVEGEAVLAGKQPATFFLKRRPDGTYVIVGMAQGHYVIEAPSGRTTERRTLRPLRIDALVPRLGHTLGEPDAARVAVTGKTIAEVRALIAKERANAR